MDRYVALGDSTTEGLEDPLPDGGYLGFADRLAGHLADAQEGPLLYANLAVRGRKTSEVRREQLPAALAMAPDLVSLVVGVNDVLRVTHDLSETAEDLDAMHEALSGATVVTFTFPDLAQVMPAARLLKQRLRTLNAAIRDAALRHGAVLADLEEHALGRDLRYWHDDRLHGSPHGHAIIATILAQRLGVPAPPYQLLGEGPRNGWRDELAWARRHLTDYASRHARGVKLGDGIEPKRPQLLPVHPQGEDPGRARRSPGSCADSSP